MKALIVGCGYLGTRVARRWIDSGYEVAALTRTREKADALRSAGIEPLVGDVTDPSSLAALPAADVVLYAVGYDRGAGIARRAVVVEGLENTLAALAGKTPRLIFISTTSLYGQSQGEWIDETSPTTPTSEAGRIALDAETSLSPFAPRKGALFAERKATIILRLSGLYGPDRLLRRIEQLRAGEPIAGDGDAWLNLIHVDDAATAVLRAATDRSPSPQGEGSGVRGSLVRSIAEPDEELSDSTTNWEEPRQATPLTPSPSPQGEGSGARTLLVSDDRPVRRREYYGRLAELTRSPPPMFDPAQATRSAGLGKRCRNERAKRELGLSLRFPTYVEGLAGSIGE